MRVEMEGQATASRPLRADAERNLRRLLDAAREAFAERGLTVSIDEIAKRAGVGKGTVFRRFPTKEHLVAAILCDRLEEAQRLGAGLLEGDDAGAALLQFMRAGAELQAQDRGFFEAVSKEGYLEEQVHDAKQALLAVTGALLTRAQEQGVVRADVTAEDVLMLECASVQAAAPFHAQAPDLWRRYLDLAFDGLRSQAAHPLSHPAPEAGLSPKPTAGSPPAVALPPTAA
jgi:AcrR family transcriptional regulator